MYTEDLIFCEKCGVYHNINYVKKEMEEYDGNFHWFCAVCKHDNYESND